MPSFLFIKSTHFTLLIYIIGCKGTANYANNQMKILFSCFLLDAVAGTVDDQAVGSVFNSAGAIVSASPVVVSVVLTSSTTQLEANFLVSIPEAATEST
jgi:hypothetical protein